MSIVGNVSAGKQSKPQPIIFGQQIISLIALLHFCVVASTIEMDDTEAALPLALPHRDVISRLKAYQANSNDAEWLNCVFWWISLWVIWHQIVFHFSYCADFRACKQPRCPSLLIRNLALGPPLPSQSLSSLIVIRHSFEFFSPQVEKWVENPFQCSVTEK